MFTLSKYNSKSDVIGESRILITVAKRIAESRWSCGVANGHYRIYKISKYVFNDIRHRSLALSPSLLIPLLDSGDGGGGSMWTASRLSFRSLLPHDWTCSNASMRNRECQELNNADIANIRCCSLIKKSNYLSEYVHTLYAYRAFSCWSSLWEWSSRNKPLTKRVY